MTMIITDRAKLILDGKLVEAGLEQISEILPIDDAFNTIQWQATKRGEKVFRCYGLIKSSRLVYIGQSYHLRSRIGTHRHQKNPSRKEWDSMFHTLHPTEGAALWWESLLIDALRPEENAAWGTVIIRRCVVETGMKNLFEYLGNKPLRNILERAMQFQMGNLCPNPSSIIEGGFCDN